MRLNSHERNTSKCHRAAKISVFCDSKLCLVAEKKTKAAVERVNERTATKKRKTANSARTHKTQNYIEVNNTNNDLIHAMEIMGI